MTFAVGSLVRARGREWVVLPNEGEKARLLSPPESCASAVGDEGTV